MNIKVYINESEYTVNVDIENESDFNLISTSVNQLKESFIDKDGTEKTKKITINYSINSKYDERVFFYE